MMKPDKLLFSTGKTVGRKVTTTFSGFYGYHDKIIFQDIEDDF